MKPIDKKIFNKFYSDEKLHNAIDVHLDFLQNWISAIGYFGEFKQRNILSTTIEIKLISENNEINENLILKKDSNFLILGSPGSGKTVLVKRLIQKILSNTEEINYQYPILIRARELNENNIWSTINEILGFNYQKEKDLSKSIINTINENKLIVFIDGLDEIDLSKSNQVIKDIEKMYNHITTGKLVTTSRTSALNYSFDCEVLEIGALSQDQINYFSQIWFNDSTFFNELKNTKYFDTTNSPLILSQLASIYKRFGSLPNKPVSVYKKFISLLIEDWDTMRGIKRRSFFNDFSNDKKSDILSIIAYELLKNNKSIFNKDSLFVIYEKLITILSIDKTNYQDFFDEMETFAGIFIKTGVDQYSFSHLSIQEYLAAEYLVRMPLINPKEVLIETPNVLALMVVISSSPVEYFKFILNNIDFDNLILNKFEIFINRLMIETDKIEKIKFLESLENIISSKTQELQLQESVSRIIKTAYNNVYKK